MAIWGYLAPKCTYCGFDKHQSAMEMHHLGQKDELIPTLVAELSSRRTSYKAEKLLREAKRSIPLCSNCHRMLHAGVIQIPSQGEDTEYSLVELMALLEAIAE